MPDGTAPSEHSSESRRGLALRVPFVLAPPSARDGRHLCGSPSQRALVRYTPLIPTSQGSSSASNGERTLMQPIGAQRSVDAADRSPIQEEGPMMTNDSLSNAYGAAGGEDAATSASSSPTNDLRGDVSALASDAGDAGRRVADVAKDETRSVASETRRQASRFMAGRSVTNCPVRRPRSRRPGRRGAPVSRDGFGILGDGEHGSRGSGYASQLVRGAGERAERRRSLARGTRSPRGSWTK